MTDGKALRGTRGRRPLMEKMARAILSHPTEEYTEAERERVREALEQRPDLLARVLAEIHRAREGEGGG